MSKNWWIDISLVVMFIFAVGVLAFQFLKHQPKGKWYDCTIAEISPDFPPEVRDECRKMRSEAYKNGRI
jgi:hypothetical protein